MCAHPYESLKGYFPPESDLKGKKEFIMVGGGLEDIAVDKKTLAVKSNETKFVKIVPATSPEALDAASRGTLGTGAPFYGNLREGPAATTTIGPHRI